MLNGVKITTFSFNERLVCITKCDVCKYVFLRASNKTKPSQDGSSRPPGRDRPYQRKGVFSNTSLRAGC